MTQQTISPITPPGSHFYRRPLPSICTEFGSEYGKKLFVGALLEGNMNIYFKLAAQFQTQDDPAFCGLSTLVMTLNALEVDPGRVWKGPWRWYHESMLDCCKPLEQVQKSGINFEQFSCLARCNRLKVEKVYADSDEDVSIEKFRTSVLKSVKSDDVVLIISYNRAELQQTGSGHYSPIGGYHSESDKVLILDVARFKYPPHWVDLQLVWRAMHRPRGYMLLSIVTNLKPLLLLQVVMNYHDLNDLYLCTKDWLSKKDFAFENDDFIIVSSLMKMWTERSLERAVAVRDELETIRNGCCCSPWRVGGDRVNEAQMEILNELKSLSEYVYLSNELQLESKVCLLIVSLFLAWPFEIIDGIIAKRLAKYSALKLDEISDLTRHEIVTLKSQVSVIMSEVSRNTCLNCIFSNL